MNWSDHCVFPGSMELVFIIAGLALVLIAVPVIAPHVGIVGGVVCLGVAVKFFLRAQAAAVPLPPGAMLPKFRWDVDLPIAIAVALYGALWIASPRRGHRSGPCNRRGRRRRAAADAPARPSTARGTRRAPP
jgi:hypothetical protein